MYKPYLYSNSVFIKLQTGSIEPSENLDKVLGAFELFIPAILQNEYEEWGYESLDGIYIAKASKVNVDEAEFFGMCLLISAQTLTPFYIRLRVAKSKDEIEWCHCKVGERHKGSLLKIPYSSSKWRKYLVRMGINSIDWFYDLLVDRQ